MVPGTAKFATFYSPEREYNALYELTDAQKTTVISALGAWSAVASLNFTLTTDDRDNVGDLRFGGYRWMDNKTAAWAYFPDNLPVSGDVWIGPQTSNPDPVKGTYDYMTFVHEIGHALGLKHPFDTSATNNTVLNPLLDDVHFTVMSYNSNYSYQPTTPMVLDILAIQSLYGANMLWQTGDTVYKWDANQSIFETIWDAGGNDTIDGSNQLAAVNINLNEGNYSQIGKAFTDLNSNTAINDGLAIAYGAKIENAIGSAFDDVLTGNALNNVLTGGAGSDTLDGGAGSDTLIGGTGDDIYIVDSRADTVIEATDEGRDVIRSSVSYTLSANIEDGVLLGDANINFGGNALDNTLTGNTGNNILDGMTGADTMAGGAGNDTYYVDNAGDVIVENGTSVNEIDTVFASLDWTLGNNLENLVLRGEDDLNGTGNALNNILTGNTGNNTLNGGAGNDTLDGGAGTDTLIGGAGDDTYIIDSLTDTIIESAGEGRDAVRTFVSYTLADNIEDGVLLGTSGLSLTGNAQNNTLTGNAGNNTLDGGAGADTLIGGDGNDLYLVDNVQDVVIEANSANSGIDTVQSTVSWAMSANLENLTLLGSANLNGTGNAQNNTLTGNAGNNILDGGAGIDTLSGGAGDDVYVVDRRSDTVIELAGEGHDVIRSSVSYTLSANVEDGVLLGTANLNFGGNALSNTLTGNAGDNVLDGLGGTDTLIGGAGDDIYYINGQDDTVIEAAGEGRDVIRSSVSYTLSANVEDGVLLGTAGLSLTGNAQNNTLTGNAGNNILDGGAGADTLIGGDGNDLYLVDNAQDVVIETDSANSGIDTVQSTVSWAMSANLENLTLLGSANLNGTGNALNNTLTGNAGNNILDGGAGIDTLTGGAGDDVYVVENRSDTVIELAGEGHDVIRSSVSYTLSANVEDGVLLGTANLNFGGNTLSNTLTGNAGNNVLDGLGGTDTLIGGAGDDIYYINGQDDTVIEAAGEGRDVIRSNVSYTLSANVEDGVLLGTAGLSLTGNAQNNTLSGNAGNNTLDGGAGIDTLIGGAGDDVYIVETRSDTVIEAAGEGRDVIHSSVSYTLSANVEDGVLLGTANINFGGNALSNTLTGNAGNNVLDGLGGTDTLIGGAGDDTYYINGVGDTVIEAADEGHDLIRTNVSYTLSANVEDGVLLGNTRLSLTGNAQDNALTGNAADNTLSGNAGNDILDGGAGNDTLIGGTGDDAYVVDSRSDTVIELAGEGHDVIRSSVSYTLSANVEDGVLLGTANLNFGGNALSNTLTGNAGNNVLDGLGGTDTLIGGAGDDIYYINDQDDTVIEAAGEGRDVIRSNVSYTLSANVEDGVLLGTAGLSLTGNAQNNTLSGNAGNNTLDGGAGIDTLIGGAGDDVYIVETRSDTVIEAAGEGRDVIHSSVSYTLSANVEDGVLLGTANINFGGNALSNTLTGNAGNNVLDGLGGTDTLIGGAGDDTYYINGRDDTVIEQAGEGHDVIRSNVSYTLSSNVEDGVLLGTANLNFGGNALSNTLTGNAGNNVLDGLGGTDTLIGGAGDDIYYINGQDDTVIEAAGEGRDVIRSNVSYTLSANVEDGVLLGTAGLSLTGNAQNNTLSGNAGNNTLDGGAGIDTLIGGAGDDVYIVDTRSDTVIEAAGEGRDVIRSSVSYTLSANVEDGVLLGTANINFGGNALSNTLTGNAGNNVLDGLGGTDTLIGGAGDDTYYINGRDDTVIEAADEGHDVIRSNVSYTLSANVEDGVLLGTANLNFGGNALSNTLTGNAGNNVLDGLGGTDTLIGGAGDDIYYINGQDDIVIEAAGEGRDVIRSNVSYTLSANVEDGVLLGTAGLSLTGNAQNNTLSGNAGNNTLDGGAGIDTLIGGAGDDVYIVDTRSDIVIEAAGEGRDVIHSSVSYTLSANVEDGVLLGTANINFGGNALSNTLTGNAGNNVLDGLGGTDTLIGGAGDDTYYINGVGDTVIEAADEGHDLIRSNVSYTLSANVEDGVLLGNAGLSLTGNTLNNTLTGNAGNNILDGGAGVDTLIGGTGADIFKFSHVSDMGVGTNRDVINDFNALQGDKIDLTAFDANLMTAGFNGFTFIGAGDFSGAGQLRFVDHVLSGNVSGNAGADFEIQLVGVNTFSANDLLA
ncbi:M10 family metallopeptidase C-terminal domain-containing protein [Pseudomonas zeae]|uniref:M10 family metallopeptidase C-terminal domain-containing protein n=1 Tax=Pseudomonas zeae TaxID=2745510 RepID=A0ABU5BIV9_9PSED|nr:M10 family metallopeptidase C-terminal domain-containing protein [Pseudomonas zeae]MDX9676544.1 M10 family metallopeptidase C-terminal domain-containing protein [Pseudomonas zeae]